MRRILICLMLLLPCAFASAKDFKLSSPDGNLVATVSVDGQISYNLVYKGEQIITPSKIALTLSDGTVLGQMPRLASQKKGIIDEVLHPVAYRKADVRNNCNYITLAFKGGYSLELRAFDNGFAYRFNLSQKSEEVIISKETAEFNFPSDYKGYFAYANSSKKLLDQYECSFENRYEHVRLSEMEKGRILFLPTLLEASSGCKIAITEANLFSYPGMFLANADGSSSLKADFAPYPKRMELGGHNNLQLRIKERENFIAKVAGHRTLPWRIISVSSNDRELADCDLVYCLADECQIDDTSWIRPGKVAWDWWNDWNIEGVDFRAGINNATYKYYIDFASRMGIEYVILDEGWAVNKKADMMQVIDEIDIRELVEYGKRKNVGIILWGGFQAIDKQMDKVCSHYAQLGVKGFKIDFMDRDDQLSVEFYERLARTAAKYKLMLDFHGAFKPTGLNRTLPNVINYEGVYGLEQMKWDEDGASQVIYDVTIPFIRQMAGPLDYTQGAMRNANRDNYYPCNTEPMSCGTRCRQLAEYIIFESPINMLCDAPTAYEKEPEYTKFLASIPTTWDETRVIDGKVGEYIITARRKGSDWYVGGLTDWTAREINVDLSFIDGIGSKKVTLFRDGVNADRRATDYKRVDGISTDNGRVSVKMFPGGGFLIKVAGE